MPRTWLLLDCNYLAYRAFYTTGGLEWDGNPTGVVYGLLRDIIQLQQEHASDHFIFAFDHGDSLRKQLLPSYKATRRGKAPLEEHQVQALLGLKDQITALKRDYLPSLGYSNILYKKGYEADDIIAHLVHHIIPYKDRVIMVSADKDLYQLLDTERVVQWNPRSKQLYTEKTLAKDYAGIAPVQWYCVKAIAGCGTDDIDGVPGVGDITAAKFLRGLLKSESKASQAITANQSIMAFNLPLVRLPYAGLEDYCPILLKDEVLPSKWKALANRLGIKSLLNKSALWL